MQVNFERHVETRFYEANAKVRYCGFSSYSVYTTAAYKPLLGMVDHPKYAKNQGLHTRYEIRWDFY